MPQKPPDSQVSFRDSFNLFYLLANIHIRCVTPFLRTGIGVRSQGFLSVVSGGAMFYTAHAIYDQMLLNYFLAVTVHGAAVHETAYPSNIKTPAFCGVSEVSYIGSVRRCT